MSSRIEDPKEYQILGIPGAGKTTALTKAIENAASQVGGENLIISSFTRAAAQELVSRDLPVPDQNIGTLHSLCYRALGTPPLAEKYIKQFNEEYPRCALSAKQHIDIDDEGQDSPHDDDKTIGDSDAWFQEYNINRAKMLPEEKWSPQATFFARNWEEWKEANGYVDFTDMISICLRDAPYPPGAPLIGVFDEAQDFTPLQLELVRSWANQLRYILIAGDDDQAIYGFTGADPSVLLNEDLPDERKRILSHSFRCPKAVQDHARFWIEKISDREPKEQYPRQENGETILGQVDRIPYRYTESERVVDEIENSLKEMPREKEVMVLTSCSYMLSPILSELRRRGIPFANRYKKRRGDWNPLRLDGKSKSTASRVLSYLEPEGPVFQGRRLWTTQQLRNWIELCNSSGFLQKGSKNTIIQAAEESLSKKGLFELIANSFKPEKLDQALQLELDFLRRNLSATKAKAFEFPETVICRRGIEELKQKPRVTVGTIHSVKGGQADHVILFPDISYRAAQNAEADRESNQAVIRAFYVGMTRARERLTIGEPRSGLHIYI